MNAEPWEQQPGERPPAFEAFCRYRDMGLSRSLAKVGRKWGKTASLLERWSSRYDWVQRASAYDRELDREWILEMRTRRREAQRRNLAMAELAMEMVAARVTTMDIEHASILDLCRLIDAFVRLERWALSDGAEGHSSESVEVRVLTAEEQIDLLRNMRSEIDQRLNRVDDRDARSRSMTPDLLPAHERPDLRIAG